MTTLEIKSRSGIYLDACHSLINGKPSNEFKYTVDLNWSEEEKLEDFQLNLIRDIIFNYRQWLNVDVTKDSIILSVATSCKFNPFAELPKPKRRGFDNSAAEVLEYCCCKIAMRIAELPLTKTLKKLNNPASAYSVRQMIFDVMA